MIRMDDRQEDQDQTQLAEQASPVEEGVLSEGHEVDLAAAARLEDRKSVV